MTNLKEFGLRVKSIRTNLGLSQQDLATKIGYTSRSSINKLEKGLVDVPQTKIATIALILGTTPAYLMGWIDNPDRTDNPSSIDTPTTQAVEYKEVETLKIGDKSKVKDVVYTGKKVAVQKSDLQGRKKEDCFVLRIKNDINAPRLIVDDEILCCRCDKVENGEIAVVYYHGEEASIKQVYYNADGTIELVPANPAYRSQIIDGERLKTFRILGKPIVLYRRNF